MNRLEWSRMCTRRVGAPIGEPAMGACYLASVGAFHFNRTREKDIVFQVDVLV